MISILSFGGGSIENERTIEIFAKFKVNTPHLKKTTLIIDGLNYINSFSTIRDAIPGARRNKGGSIVYPPFSATYRSVSYGVTEDAATDTAIVFKERGGERPFQKAPIETYGLGGPSEDVINQILAHTHADADRLIYVTKRIDESFKRLRPVRGVVIMTKGIALKKDESDDITCILLGMVYNSDATFIMSNDKFVGKKARDHMSCVNSLQRIGHSTRITWDVMDSAENSDGAAGLENSDSATEKFLPDVTARMTRAGIAYSRDGDHLEITADNALYHKLCDFIMQSIEDRFIPINPRAAISRMALSLVCVNKSIKYSPGLSPSGFDDIEQIYLERTFWELIHRVAVEYLRRGGRTPIADLLARDGSPSAKTLQREIVAGKARAFVTSIEEAIDGMNSATKKAFIKIHAIDK